MRRAMLVSEGSGPLEAANSLNQHQSHDHPFFGQIFLAFMLNVFGYPGFADPSTDNTQSIYDMYFVPRLLMGLLAVIDTFLVYKIAEKRYSRSVAFIASVLFAVMPMTWLLRRILLDSILLPFLLSSILFAVHYSGGMNQNRKGKPEMQAVIFAGIFLGLAIFTKIPAITFIPLVSYLLTSNSTNGNWRTRWKTLGILFIPVILIPALWPIHAIRNDQVNELMDGINWQLNRSPKPLFDPPQSVIEIDPVIVALGIIGGIYVTIRRDFIFILWAFPYILFLYLINYSLYIHIVLLFPLFCITAGIFVESVSRKLGDLKRQNNTGATISNKVLKDQNRITKYLDSEYIVSYVHAKKLGHIYRIFLLIRKIEVQIIPSRVWIIAVSLIGIFGFVSTAMLISTDVNSSFFDAYTAFVERLPDTGISKAQGDGVTLITSTKWGIYFFWIPKYVFNKNIAFLRDSPDEIAQTEKTIIIGSGLENQDEKIGSTLIGKVNNTARNYDYTKYPYTNMRYNELADIEIRANY